MYILIKYYPNNYAPEQRMWKKRRNVLRVYAMTCNLIICQQPANQEKKYNGAIIWLKISFLELDFLKRTWCTARSCPQHWNAVVLLLKNGSICNQIVLGKKERIECVVSYSNVNSEMYLFPLTCVLAYLWLGKYTDLTSLPNFCSHLRFLW